LCHNCLSFYLILAALPVNRTKGKKIDSLADSFESLSQLEGSIACRTFKLLIET